MIPPWLTGIAIAKNDVFVADAGNRVILRYDKSSKLIRRIGEKDKDRNIPGLIITEAILGYLGIGLRPSTDSTSFFITSWGALMLDGQSAINSQPFLLLAPAICVALIVLAFTFLGDGLRDALDPRMRGAQ